MKFINEANITFPSNSSNESFARMSVAAFVSQLDPTVEELAEIKTMVSEAVTNCVVHAYENTIGLVRIRVQISDSRAVQHYGQRHGQRHRRRRNGQAALLYHRIRRQGRNGLYDYGKLFGQAQGKNPRRAAARA